MDAHSHTHTQTRTPHSAIYSDYGEIVRKIVLTGRHAFFFRTIIH